jgi:predicted hydrocarbon binding protein
VSAFNKGLSEEGKITNKKCQNAIDNLLTMLASGYEGVKEDDNLVHPILVKIARDAVAATAEG